MPGTWMRQDVRKARPADETLRCASEEKRYSGGVTTPTSVFCPPSVDGVNLSVVCTYDQDFHMPFSGVC